MQRTLMTVAVTLALMGCPGNEMSSDGGTGGGTGGSGGGTGGGTAQAVSCESYCTTIMANCKDSHAQYTTQESCLGNCSAFEAGTAGATTGNNVQCRAYHGGAPAVSDATTHCPHAGPTGDATCGASNCESFCKIILAKCTGDNKQFEDNAACMTACQAYPNPTARYVDTTTTSGNSFACRMYHLSVAASNATLATTHCPHAGKTVSDTCK